MLSDATHWSGSEEPVCEAVTESKNDHSLIGSALPTLPSLLPNFSCLSVPGKVPPSPKLLPRQTQQRLPARCTGRQELADAAGNSIIFTTPSITLPALPTFTSAQQGSAPKHNTASPFLGRIVLEERACRASAMCGPGYSGDFVNTAPVPPCAKNKAFQLDARLRAVGDWRGDLACPRNSLTYNVASSVVAAAYRWKFSNISSIVIVYRKYTRAPSFENF